MREDQKALCLWSASNTPCCHRIWQYSHCAKSTPDRMILLNYCFLYQIYWLLRDSQFLVVLLSARDHDCGPACFPQVETCNGRTYQLCFLLHRMNVASADQSLLCSSFRCILFLLVTCFEVEVHQPYVVDFAFLFDIVLSFDLLLPFLIVFLQHVF